MNARKVRGLSLLQKRIMAVAAKGWITPSEATICANNDEQCVAAAAASRALRRLVTRGLLIHAPSRYRNGSAAYRRADWHEEIPYIPSANSDKATCDRFMWVETEAERAAMQFDRDLAARQKRLDTSLTKAEWQVGERLNSCSLPDSPNPNRSLRTLVDEDPRTLSNEELVNRLTASLTEASTPLALPDIDNLVADGRKVLVGILERQRLCAPAKQLA